MPMQSYRLQTSSTLWLYLELRRQLQKRKAHAVTQHPPIMRDLINLAPKIAVCMKDNELHCKLAYIDNSANTDVCSRTVQR